MSSANIDYDEGYFAGVGSNYGNYEKKAKDIESRYFTRIAKTAPLVKGTRVLDVGCAFGYFLRLCDSAGCSTWGVDISEYAINRAKKETRAKLYKQDVSKGLHFLDEEFFDLATIFDVVEHLQDVEGFLRDISRVLKTGGVVVITTPNLHAAERYFKKLNRTEDSWHGFKDKTHVQAFTVASLSEIVKKSGFDIVQVETPFHPLPKLAQKVLNRSGIGGQIWVVARKR